MDIRYGLEAGFGPDCFRQPTDIHIVDRLIAERTPNLSRHVLWPVLRPILYRMLNYCAARDMADNVVRMGGFGAFEHVSGLVGLDLATIGEEQVPASGPVLVVANHPTGIADGIAVYDALKARRPDMAFFANRDALRVNPRLAELVIPVEWRAGEKSHAKSRDTLVMAARAFRDHRCVVLFPSGRLAAWQDGALTERPWQTSAVALARKFAVPVVPLHISARNSGLYYLLCRLNTELRDMTLFNELLNKNGARFDLTFGAPIAPQDLTGDLHVLTMLLQDFVTRELGGRPDARPSLPCATAPDQLRAA